MKNIPNEKNNEFEQDEQSVFDLNKNIVSTVKPDKEILTRILDKIEVSSVTNNQVVRNNLVEGENFGRNQPIISNFTKIINNMNNYIKILSGGALVSALILTLVFINKSDDKSISIPLPNNITNTQVKNNTTQTRVEVGGEVLNIDSLLADLDSIDSAYDEPILDDSDLTASLINTNDYEIQ